MDRRRLKFLVLGIGIVAVMAGLLAIGITSSGGFVYYLTVSEFVEQGATEGGNFRINGKVRPGSIERLAGGSRVRFVMVEGSAALPVDFEGVIPDTFVDEADVVVDGAMHADGTFHADTLLAKCPSKYEAAAESGEEMPHSEKTTGEI
jgi:cytochrome c-type biogenesis protein CcmE